MKLSLGIDSNNLQIKWQHYHNEVIGFDSTNTYGIVTLQVTGVVMNGATSPYPTDATGFTFEMALDKCYEPTVIFEPTVAS